ncbi:MAG: putative bifunctional diguanylate cyclase/phosphodiesterase, partial [Pseudolabrys sp.]
MGAGIFQAIRAPQVEARRTLGASRLIVVVALLAFGASIMTAGVGYSLARQSDERLWTEQRTALRAAISEFRALFGQTRDLDPRFVRMVERSVNISGLAFEAEPTAGRETQPVIDGSGRIAGFFTWEKTHPMMDAMNRLVPLIAGMTVVLIGFAAFSLWQLRRARGQLAASEELARRAADEDKLTGLPNHAKMLELLDLALAERTEDEIVTFALIELDGMDDVTAHHGVLGSDELIVAAAGRLKESLPEHAVCGRIGTDEFAVILTSGAAVDSEAVLRGAIEQVARPYWVDTVARLSAHSGFSLAPAHGETRGEITRRTELALRAASVKGPGTLIAFDPAIDKLSAEQRFIHRELPRAITAHELEVHYQPIVSSAGGAFVGVEALLRWTHATQGPISPAAFIPVAEQMGLMDSLGTFVLRKALQDAKRWPGLYVAVNLSPLQVRDRGIIDVVRSALSESGVPPPRLMLEITEGVLIDNPDEMIRRIEDLHALGVRVALDDFGSGYSNLSYLQRFPLDKLKIDR